MVPYLVPYRTGTPGKYNNILCYRSIDERTVRTSDSVLAERSLKKIRKKIKVFVDDFQKGEN